MTYFTVCAHLYYIFLRNLLFLKNYSGNVEDLSLNFTVVNNDLGESQVSQTKQLNWTAPISHLQQMMISSRRLENCWIPYYFCVSLAALSKHEAAGNIA